MDTYELIYLSQQGDQAAKEALIKENHGLIQSTTSKFCHRGLERDDLYQIAAIGFLKAVENFNFSLQLKFSTYAVPMMIGEIKRYFRDNHFVKVSRKYKTLAMKANAFCENYVKEKGEEPPLSLVAGALKVEKEELALALSSLTPALSLEAQDTENSLRLEEVLGEDKTFEPVFERIFLKESIEKLTKEEKKLLLLRYVKEQTQTEIAKRMGISQVQVSRLEKKVLLKLKQEFIVT